MEHFETIESKMQWCVRTFDYVDDDFGPVSRWVLEGRGASFERYKAFSTVSRSQVQSVDELCLAVDREIGSAQQRQVRVRAWQRGAKNQVSQRVWEVSAVAINDVDDGERYEMSPVGMHVAERAQTLRHNEMLMRVSMGNSHESLRTLAKENEALRKENAELRKEWVDAFKLIQELEDRKLERVTKAERSLTVNQGIRAAAAAVQFKMLGQPATEEERKKARDGAMTQFYESLSDEQRKSIQSALRPEQQLALTMLVAGVDEAPRAEPEDEDDDEDPDAEAFEEAEGDDDGDVPGHPEPLGPRALKMLKAVLSSDEYAAALSLLRVERGLIDEPELLIEMAKEEAAKGKSNVVAKGASGDAAKH